MSERAIEREVTVPAPPDAVWRALTTDDGARTFFAPEAHIVPEPGGAFELLFMLEAPEGSRGSEGCTVVSLEPERSLEVTWNFPPHLSIRGEHTRVRFELAPHAEGTHVHMRHTGWKEGGDWDTGFAYFERAWTLVLARLRRSFEHGPIDWSDPWSP